MGECKVKTLSRPTHPFILSSTTNKFNSSMGSQNPTTASNASLVRCPADILTRLRRLHEAEIITLFTPLVPHPPCTTLPKDMDPFEPLGRALPRRVRHVPYRLDHGMTETHKDFLPASGAVLVVICVTGHILAGNPHAFEQQVKFARGISKEMAGNAVMTRVPVVLLLVSDQVPGRNYGQAVQDFPALISIDDYTSAAFTHVVGVLFGK